MGHTLTINTGAPLAFFQQQLPYGKLTLRALLLDSGAFQHDAFTVDMKREVIHEPALCLDILLALCKGKSGIELQLVLFQDLGGPAELQFDAGQIFVSLDWTYAVLSMSLMCQRASTYMPPCHVKHLGPFIGIGRALRPCWPRICSKGARLDY